MMELADQLLRGSYPPLVTPFQEGEVDLPQYRQLVDTQVSEGSHGIVVCGTTGEPTTLTLDERKQLAEAAITAARGRCPVIVATGSQSYAETVELTVHAAESGADAVLVLTPYFARPPARGLVEYFTEIAGLIDPLPMLIYHIPGRAAVEMPVAALVEAAHRAPNLVGAKHAANDLSWVTEARIALGPDFRILCGLEELTFPMLCIGASGMVNALGNLAPRLISDLYNAVDEHRLPEALTLHNRLFELSRAVFFETNPIPLKYMMRRVGLLKTNEHRLPMVSATPELEARLDAVLERADLLTMSDRAMR